MHTQTVEDKKINYLRKKLPKFGYILKIINMITKQQLNELNESAIYSFAFSLGVPEMVNLEKEELIDILLTKDGIDKLYEEYIDIETMFNVTN